MAAVKIAITIDAEALRRVDALVKQKAFANRSRAIQAAVTEKLERVEGRRLATECAKLDRAAEKSMAESGMAADMASWPTY